MTATTTKQTFTKYNSAFSRKLYLSLLLLFCVCNVSPAQQNTRTFAVVIGISTYSSPGIPSLEFADQDATHFAAWLKSAAGGQVPDANILLLRNEEASYTAVYHALDWLTDVCREGDLVYFYFSGHGDMESSTLYKLGFLLTANTPRTNYINNALRIEDLNNYANTLSVISKAKVVLITDACHSGRLAGAEYRGSFLTGEQLKTVMANEVRIASCTPGQLSVEDEQWGGGRGVFSYYLLNGLTGMAEQNKDGMISVKELGNYLRNSLNNDLVLKNRGQLQTPVLSGNESFTLSRVNESALSALQESLRTGQSQRFSSLPALPPDLVQTVFKNLNKRPETYADYEKLMNIAPAELPLAVLAQFKLRYRQNGTPLLDMLAADIRKNPDAVKRFNRKFVEVIADRGQAIVNYYLNGDEAEIERRRYYNSFKNEYSTFANMFGVALKLTDAKSPLARILAIKYHYFKGVACRLKMSAEGPSAGLIDSAFAAQNQALLLEENAAYIHNEIGFLYMLKNDYAKAETAFKKATEIAPGWAVPWSNLAALCLRQNNYEAGLNHINKAKALQSDYAAAYIHAGLLFEKKHNWLAAEENQQKCIALNSRFYLPYERLGTVYTQTTQYALADSFFYEAACRKEGFFVDPVSDAIGDGGDGDYDHGEKTACSPSQNPAADDVMALFALAMKMIEKNELTNAETTLKKVITLEKRHPLAHHYLGRVLRLQKRWLEAELFFSYAQQFYLIKTQFVRYADSTLKAHPSSDACIRQVYIKNYYDKQDDLFLLADVYEQWNHFSEAEQCYEKIIRNDSVGRAGYQKLWELLEKNGRYEDAEKLLFQFRAKCAPGPEDLNAFYRRVTEKFPASGDWLYRAGNFHYKEAEANPRRYAADVDQRIPDKDVNPSYNELYEESDKNYSFDLGRKSVYVPGTHELLTFGDSVQFPRLKAIGYFRAADSLLADDFRRADLLAKIGDLYVAMKNIQQANAYYLRSSKLQSDNAGLRSKLITTLDADFQFAEAMKQMDTLQKRKELSYHHLLLLIKYCAHQGDYEKAKELLKYATEINPLGMPETADLNGRICWFSGQYQEAIPFYTTYLSFFPNSTSAMYTLARLYCVTGKRDECYQWLGKSISKGFKYYWVLLNDPVFAAERSSPLWNTMTAAIKPKPIHQTNQTESR